MNLDQEIRAALRSSVRPADEIAGYRTVQARLHRPHPSPRERTNRLHVALYASLAVVIVVAITVGSLEASKRLGNDHPIVRITDDTTAASLGGPAPVAPASESSAAMFRGNAARTGVYPSGGPTSMPEVLWKFKTGESEGSSPVVSDGVVYVAGSDWNLHALDAHTGQERWKFPAYYGVTSSPAVADGLVYFGTADGYLYALDAASGQEKWKFQVNRPIELNPVSSDSYTIESSPAVAGGVVYFGTGDGYLYALDATSGELEWKFQAGDGEDPPGIISSPAVSNGVVYFGTWSGHLHALDAQTGQERWRYKVDEVYGSIWSSPAVVDEVVYFGSAGGDDGGNFYALDAQTGRQKWKHETDGRSAIRSSPAVSGPAVYFLYDDIDAKDWSGGTDAICAVALDINTGTELWRTRVANERGWGIGIGPSLSISGGVAYFGAASEGGRIHALDTETGGELWTWAFSPDTGLVTSSPAISNGVLYFSGSDGYLYALGSGQTTVGTTDVTSRPSTTTQTPQGDASAAMFRGNAARTGVYPGGGPTSTPQLLWRFNTGISEGSSPVVAGGVVYVGDSDRRLCALDAETGEVKWKSSFLYSGVISGLAVSDGVIYTGSWSGYFCALDAKSGREIWRFHEDNSASAFGNTAIESSPALSDGLVYFGDSHRYFYALDAANGRMKWRFDKGAGGSVAPSPAVSDGAVYVVSDDGFSNYLHALDAQTGEEQWRAEVGLTADTTYNVDTLAVSDGLVYVVAGLVFPDVWDWGARGYVCALDAASGQEAWRREVSGDLVSSLAVSDGVVYFGAREGLLALDARTGEEKWRREMDEGISSSPAIAGGVVYFVSSDGRLCALDASTGEQLSAWALDSPLGEYINSVSPSPVFSDGIMYLVGAVGYLYALK